MLRKLLREPLLHFLVLGAALFALANWSDDPAGPAEDRIVVTPGRIEHLAAGFRRTWQRPPTEQELQGLIDSHIREEIYYREALALGLDKDDTIVRRRLMQKLEFLTAEISDAVTPSDDELQAYLQQHADTFRLEPQIAFRQIYLNPERHGGNLTGAARNLLARLEAGDLPSDRIAELGDPIMLPAELGLSRRGEIARLFGDAFAERLLAVEPGRWAGPIESGYGLHLVRIDERRAARLPALDEVRDLVLREWLNDRRERLSEQFYRQLRERYTVVIESPGDTPERGADLAGIR